MAELRVLVCDDDHDMLELMLRRLDKMGFKPDRAGDGGIATALIKENLYDLIVTEIYLPEATGLELLELAKQRDPQVQVVIVTASATLDNAIDALNHGAFGYLSKPFDHLSVFDSTVSRALEFRQLIMANRRMAEAQKMRGDMLEDEVAKRVGQLREKQQGLLDLLNCLPDGIVVVEEGGKLMMTSPAAEQWLARERRTEQQPIADFLGQVHSEWAENSGYAQLGDDQLRLLSIDYPHPNGKKRKAVIIRRSEEEEEGPAGQGTLAVESMAAIKEGLAWLFRQKLSGAMQERVKQLANHISMLEQLTGGIAPSDNAPSGAPPALAPAELPEYLRHEPALDEPGAQWVDTAPASGQNGSSAPDAEQPRRPEPDTQPAASRTKEQPPEAAAPAHEPEPEPSAEAADELVEEKLESEAGQLPVEAEQAEQVSAEVEAEQVETISPEAPPVEDEHPAAAEAAEGEALATDPAADEEPDDSQAETLDESDSPPADLATAPTKALSHAETELAVEAQAEPASESDPPEEPAATAGPADTGRIPLWQRVSKKHAAAPAKPSRSTPKAQVEAAAEFALEPELEAGAESEAESSPDAALEEQEQLSDVEARLEALAKLEPESEPAPQPKPRQEAAKPPKAQASPKPSRAQKAAVSEPELAVAGPEAGLVRGKKKVWPPKLPSQDPDFDPELDVTG